MGYLICVKCKGYYKLQSGESPKEFIRECDCGGNFKYVRNLDIVDPSWKQIYIRKKTTRKEIIKNKLLSIRKIDIRNRLRQFYYNNFQGRFNNRNRRIHKNPHGMDPNLLNSISNELNFHNIRWILVIPVVIAITIILAFFNGIFTLIIFILLVALGYLFDDRIIGTKNAVVAGAISFFLGNLLSGSFLYLIPFTLLGIINGAVCGWIGGYIKTRI